MTNLKLDGLKHLRADFDSDFLWGASVSPHQVEGHNINQWSKWEEMTANYLAKTADSRLSWIPAWPDVSQEALKPENYLSAQGVAHFKRYKEDFRLARSLNLNSMRSGIEWSRICPSISSIDLKAVQHYQEYFKQMKSSGIEPVVNLFHWSLPKWFAEMGGFTKRANLNHWRNYVNVIIENIDLSEIRYVITINEANTYANMSYAVGEFPPGAKNYLKAWSVYRNLAKAHKIAYQLIKSKYPNIQIGVAHQCNKIIGEGVSGKFMARLQLWYWNNSWLRWAKYHDFIGFNYYFADYRKGVSLVANNNPKRPLNDLGWYMEPSGILWVLKDLSKRWPGKPILVTENGVADLKDQYREWWIAETIQAMHGAKQDGVNLIGYMHWSLLDNFEWQYGWFPKFGLIMVDRSTMKRRLKNSARAWSNWLKE